MRIRIDRVDQRRRRPVVALDEIAHRRQGSVEVATHGDNPGACRLGLEQFALGDLAGGQDDDDLEPGAAPYAAAEAAVLPVDAQMIARDPSSIALATATTMPRSLNEPVGFMPSTLRWSSGAAYLPAQVARVNERRVALAQADVGRLSRSAAGTRRNAPSAAAGRRPSSAAGAAGGGRRSCACDASPMKSLSTCRLSRTRG